MNLEETDEENLEERLKEGYKATAERDRKIAEEMIHVSIEANRYIDQE
ncbi:hypothetical protein [Candidatus Nanohalobium constans]|nr:hypothetical protein [Candidatus Nanohalobium constans]